VTGALRPVYGGSVGVGQVWAQGFAIDPLGRFVFTANQHPGFYSLVSSLHIDQMTGALTSGSASVLSALPSQCCDVNLQTIVDPLGRFLFVATNVGFFVYTIDGTTGALTLASSIPFFPPVGYSSQQPMAVDRSGKYLYVGPTGNTAGNYIDAYQIDQTTGALSPVPGSPFPADQGGVATSIVIDPLGQFVYVTNEQFFPSTYSSVSAYKLISSTGALSQIKGSPFTSPSAGDSYIVSLTFHPSGAYAYWMDSSGAVTTYSVDAQTGALHDGVATLPASSRSSNHAGESAPFFQTAIDPSGKFLFIVNEGPFDPETFPTIENYIAIFAIDSNTGALTQSRDSPFYAPDVGNPTRVEIYASP
jgi:6-phosphogluconolactonase